MASNLRVDSIVPSTGANVSIGTATGGVTIPGDLGIAGVLTYEDVTNVDSVGVITARNGGYLDIRTGSSINTNATGSAASGTIHKNTNSGEFAVVSGGTGGNNHLTFYTSASAAPTEKLRIGPVGQLGIGGANYGTDGQVLTSKGPSAAIQWATVSTTPFGGALDGLNFGGTETTYTSGGTTYKVHSFTSSGFFRVTAAISVDFLIVGGGGGTAAAELSYGATGGGGAGGMVEGTGITIPAGKHTITVGQGGAASNAYNVAGSGGDSSFNYGTTVTAKGGGVVLIMRVLVLMVDLVLVVLNLMELLVHLPNHHKTLVYQVLINLVMLVVLLLDTRVVLVVEVVLVVLVKLDQLVVLVDLVEQTQSQVHP